MTCPRCGGETEPIAVIDDPEQDGLDARTQAFCARMLERGCRRRYAVYRCLDLTCACGAEMRVYVALPTPTRTVL